MPYRYSELYTLHEYVPFPKILSQIYIGKEKLQARAEIPKEKTVQHRQSDK